MRLRLHELLERTAKAMLSHRTIRTVGLFLIMGLSLIRPAASQTVPRSWPYEANVGTFEVHSDFLIKDKQVLHDTLDHLQGDLTEILKLPTSQKPIHIVLFGNDSEYTRYMQHYFPSVVPRRAIYLQDRGPGMLFTSWHADIETDLRHEAAHALLNQSGSQLPLWLDEGLAEYFEVDRDRRYARSPYLAEIIERSESGLIPSLMELEKIEQIAEFTNEDYRDSWAWVHLLLHRRPQTRQLVIEFLRTARNNAPQLPMSRQIAEILKDPWQEFQGHFRRFQSAPGIQTQ